MPGRGQPVENRHRCRDGRSAPVSPTAAHRPWKRRRVFHSAPTPALFLPTNPKKGPRLRSHPTVLVQAHPSMRKCFESIALHRIRSLALAVLCTDRMSGRSLHAALRYRRSCTALKAQPNKVMTDKT